MSKRLLSSFILMIAILFSDATLYASAKKIDVKKVKVGSVELAYYTRGKGKPLVMINGFKATMATWDPALLAILEKRYQLILFDNRGAGLSTDTTDNRTSIAQMADDTAGLIKALGFHQAYVLGWSMGSRIAQQLAIRHPDVVEKLVLCAPNPGGSHQIKPSSAVLDKLLNANQTDDAALALLFSSTPDGITAARAFKSRVYGAIAAQTVPDDLTVNDQTIDRQSQALGNSWDSSNSNYDALSTIACPTLVTNGKDDVIDPPENVRIIADQIPFAWSVFLNGGHAFLFQDHQRFSLLLFIFLDG